MTKSVTGSSNPQCDVWPWAPHRCPRCTRRDTIPMPIDNLLDRVIEFLWFSPFKCRACKAKFYRRSNTIPQRPPMQSAPTPDVARCQRDPAVTLRRVENIILLAEASRSRKR